METKEEVILLLDVGNTNIYAGLSNGDDLIETFRVQTYPIKTPDEQYYAFKPITDKYLITGVIISSVVPKVTLELKKMVIKFFSLSAIVVEPGLKTGVSVKADNPREVGADLISVTAGLSEIYPTLIIDLGTATKLIYTKNKTIFGVVIMPGIEMGMKTLSSSTALLPEVYLQVPAKVLGSNTVNCIQSGILYGHASALDGLIQRIKCEVKEDFNVLLTGGLSSLIEPLLITQVERDPRLVLKGMLSIYQKNIGG